ncbi:MAG TPA: cation:proton antiporter [Vicinamibacterales bacterium]|nr:cation:proton antiporter [Vicinamibacterales bacterium]
MPHVPLLLNIGVVLAYALVGGLLARRVGLPTIVGYLVAGVALGPFTPGFRGDPEAIGQLAELGVIMLMFGVGLHFSFDDLWEVRQIAIPGALLQMLIVTAGGYLLGRHWGWSVGGAWLLGMALSVASTVVLLRTLMDYGWLETPYGKVAVGWLVFEDLVTVAILVLLPVVAAPAQEASWMVASFAIGKAILFVLLMVIVGGRLMPAILGRVVHMRSRELFVLVVLTMAVGTALASSALFGVSLALGAFVAGVVVNESPFSKQIGADVVPFQEAFAVIFFVSVGMLVNPRYLLEHWDQVAIVTLVVVVGKGIISALVTVLLAKPVRAALVIGAGRSQIGEFSFIIGQSGMALGLIDAAQYSLILAGAMVSITLNPLVLQLVPPLERAIQRYPKLWRMLDTYGTKVPLPAEGITGHVVIVGCGRVGRHIAEALGRLKIPRLVVEAEPSRLDKLQELGVPVLFGDAANSEVLKHANLEQARVLVITLPDDAAALAVVATAKRHSSNLRMVARASTWVGARRLRADGVHEVVRPELEGGIEIVRRTLLDLDLPLVEVQRYTDLVRQEGLEETGRPSAERARMLDDLVNAARDLEVQWLVITPQNPFANRTLADAQLRSTVGVSIVAIRRGEELISNPGPEDSLMVGDRAALLGTPTQVAQAIRLFEALEELKR